MDSLFNRLGFGMDLLANQPSDCVQRIAYIVASIFSIANVSSGLSTVLSASCVPVSACSHCPEQSLLFEALLGCAGELKQ
eukprot:4176360-Amphidinium_carterae.1